ncbi:MAG: arylsulfatase [Planctomycetia bacterium]|nr:arylsulfatase [Planctomycetia bacterium]
MQVARVPRLIAAAVSAILALPWAGLSRAAERAPNVLLIITDDQGFGDLGFHGNPVIKTPHIDKLAGESVELTHFYVSPVCSPTRSSLLTGRYNYRTGVVDTYLGRSMMSPDEVTLAEMFRDAGYRTGIFGKWHLGDNYPLRSIDQGFGESLVHRGGGIGQPADPPGNHYFDPVLDHNGRSEPAKGYCSDIFTDAAIRFVGEKPDQPFFAYLAFNCPHSPYEVPDDYLRRYQEQDLSPAAFPAVGNPPKDGLERETARVYGMVTNIDDNVGRLLAKLDAQGVARDTIVIFLTDNGPPQQRYNAGLRGRKGLCYEGGIRVACLVRWPGKWTAGRKVAAAAAHIDLAPTLLEACGVPRPGGARFDGVSLVKLLNGEAEELPDRTLFFQWHRGDTPELNRACAARGKRYKIVQSLGTEGKPFSEEPRFELFDVVDDPYEMHDLAAQRPDVVDHMRRAYEAWFRDVSATRGFAPPRIAIGSRHEDPVVLTRQDWRGPKAGWDKANVGHWDVNVMEAGNYDVTLTIDAAPAGAKARLAWGDHAIEKTLAPGTQSVRFDAVNWPVGPIELEPSVEGPQGKYGVLYVEVSRAR